MANYDDLNGTVMALLIALYSLSPAEDLAHGWRIARDYRCVANANLADIDRGGHRRCASGAVELAVGGD